ncbi:hypothetical protein SAMN04489740_0890 [Arthrobacter alpinus]|uniref:Uncharacterized protein n=1 Tax=Arthrobacter alpinus TaxID=656366 RepID=A0A1H5H048_9MICC|nr:hypothetical protein [Arthrobacter alpinus]SEE21111.1 hypothetical protein SAMN04489740_0890 [Arthrobacter alpinus]
MSIQAPTGYAKVKEGSDLWAGPESTDRGWIVTPAWNSATGKHFLEVWTPKDNRLTPSGARRLAQVLLATADDVEAASMGAENTRVRGPETDG